MQKAADETTTEKPGAPRLRTILLLLALQAAFIAWASDSEIARSIYLISYSLMMPTTLYLIAARAIPNSWFRPRELMLIYIALTATIPIIGFGGLRFIMPGMGFMSYFATTQGMWHKYLFDLVTLPVLHDPEAARGFFLGRSDVPWAAWMVPIVFWSLFLLSLSGAWIGIAAALRTTWIDVERLSFPVAEIPIELADRQRSVLRRFPFWVGVLVPVVLQSLLQLQLFYPTIPAIQTTAVDLRPILFPSPPWNSIQNFYLGLYPAATGLAYFVPSDISFSCWFFWLVGKLSYGLATAWGLRGSNSGAQFPFHDEQAAGAWIGLAALTLWGAWTKARTNNGSGARFGGVAGLPRRPLYLAGACLALCAGMMALVGVPAIVAVGAVVIYVAYVLAGARIRAEAGCIWTYGPLTWTPGATMNGLFGTLGVPSHALVANGYFDLVMVDVRAQSLPYLMEGLKIADATGIDTRTVFRWVAGSTVTALAFGWWFGLKTFYTIGAATAHSNHYTLARALIAMTQIDAAVGTRKAWDHTSITAILCAALFTALLAFLRTRFISFPFHPVGYVLGNTLTINSFAFPFFFAWAVRSLLLRFGNINLYRTSRLFFLGLVIGDITIQSFWSLTGHLLDWPIYPFLVN